jgi:hypothetical protein
LVVPKATLGADDAAVPEWLSEDRDVVRYRAHESTTRSERKTILSRFDR